MQQRDWRAFLEDIVNACAAIERYTSGIEWPRYESDEFLQSAVERKLTIIGEAVFHVRRLRPDQAPRLGDVRGIIDFRNLLVHGYFAVRHDVVWAIVIEEVPPLAAIAEQLFSAESEEPPGAPQS